MSSDDAQPAVEQLRLLSQFGRSLTYATSLDQVARLTVERAADLLGASAAVIMLSDAQRDRWP